MDFIKVFEQVLGKDFVELAAKNALVALSFIGTVHTPVIKILNKLF